VKINNAPPATPTNPMKFLEKPEFDKTLPLKPETTNPQPNQEPQNHK